MSLEPLLEVLIASEPFERLLLERVRPVLARAFLRASLGLRRSDVFARASVDRVGERGRDGEGDLRPVLHQCLESRARQAPRDDLGERARRGGAAG